MLTGPEIDWLKAQSGYTDDELKAFESVMGSAKFVSMLQKIQQAAAQAATDKQTAENERLALEKRYQDEFIPEMRKVTQDSLRAQAEAAAAKAALEKAREYGIVPEPVTPPAPSNEPPRAPGSPDPNVLSKADLDRLAANQSRAIITLQDLSAEHFKLFKEPLGATQELVDEVQREHTLGHKDFTLKSAWERRFKVPEKRAEIAKAERQAEIQAAVEADRKEQRQKNAANPGLVTGQPSRFSSYKPSDANQGSEPWKTPPGMKKAANQPWREKAIQKVAAA